MSGPTMPSATRLRELWNATTAVSVVTPKSPGASGVDGNPSARVEGLPNSEVVRVLELVAGEHQGRGAHEEQDTEPHPEAEMLRHEGRDLFGLHPLT